jgi:hypothetical protein
MNLKYKEIGKILNRASKSVGSRVENLSLKRKICHKFWNNLEIKYLTDNYNKIPAIKIAKYLNRTKVSVLKMANGLGLFINRKYHIPKYNECFFESWSNELAWLVGIVISDGHISDINNGKFIRIKMCDLDVIEKIKFITDYSGDIIKHIPRNPKYKISYNISLYGESVWNFFTQLGMDNHKSYTAKFPINIPEDYIIHVIRGIFDGDGSLYINKKTGYPFARICGTKNIVEFISTYIGLHNTVYINSDINSTIQYTGDRAASFLNRLYEFSTINTRMNRKYNKYLDIYEKVEMTK